MTFKVRCTGCHTTLSGDAVMAFHSFELVASATPGATLPNPVTISGPAALMAKLFEVGQTYQLTCG